MSIMDVLERIEEIECETCNGTGKEICNNPDHGFLNAISFTDTGRIGCPCCGHDEDHAIPNTVCENCNGTGKEFIVNYKVIDLAKLGKQMQWVSVKRLPELETNVDILDIDNKRYMDAWHIGDGRFLAGDIVFEADEVTHWMPLPPNPKEEV
jgi:hypothetical protein